jgi:hypothetical protein
MPRIDEWEQKLLGNLARSVQIDPNERVLLVRSFYWHRQGPREDDNAYEARVADNWPNWVSNAREAKDRILHCTGIDRQGNPIAAYRTSSLGGAGAGADPPQVPNDCRAAMKDLQMQTFRVKCSGLVNNRKARDEKIKSLKAQAKEKVSATEETIVEKKARLQVEVA